MGFFSNMFGGDAPELNFKKTRLTGAYGTGVYNPNKGTVSYNLSPELQQMRDVFYGAGMDFLPSEDQTNFANYLTSTGQNVLSQALGMNPQEMAAQYYQQGTDILAPQREQDAAMLADKLFKTGRLGFASGYGEGYVNPEQFTFVSAINQADKQRLYDAMDRAYQRQGQEQLRGLGLLEAGSQQRMLPYQNARTLFGAGVDLAGLAQNDLQNVYNFANMNNQIAQNKYNADLQNWQASGGGLFSNLATSFASGLGASLGTGGAGALGAWAKNLPNPFITTTASRVTT